MLLTGLLLFCIVAIALTIFFSKKASNNDHQEGQAVYYVGIIAIPILAATMYYGIGDPNTASLLEGTSQQKEHFDPQSHLEQINKLLSQRPDDPSLLAQVSRIYMMVGKFELAVESARRLVERGSHAAQSSRSPP